MRSHPRKFLVLALMGLALATACTTPLLVAPSSRPLGGQPYEILGPTQAESCIQSVLGIPFSTDASLHTTMAKAKEAVKADALIEVTVDRYSLTTGFYNQNCTIVHALGVRLAGGQAPFLQPGPAVPPVPPAPPAPASPPTVEEPPAAPAPAAAPAEPATPKKAGAARAEPAKKLTRAERRKLARKEARRKREAAKKKAAEDKRQAELAAKAKAEQEKRAAEDAKKKAEEEKRQAALAAKAAEEAKPVPAEFSIFCKYQPGQPVLVETKAEKIEAEFVKCVHFGVRVKKSGQEPGVIPFETIWSVRMRAPAEASPATPAQPVTPAQPRQ
jgi:hypothetical protein